MIAEQRAAEADHQRVFAGQSFHAAIEAYRVDGLAIDIDAFGPGFVRRPLVIFVKFARGDQGAKLKHLRTHYRIAQILVQSVDGLRHTHAVHGSCLRTERRRDAFLAVGVFPRDRIVNP